MFFTPQALSRLLHSKKSLKTLVLAFETNIIAASQILNWTLFFRLLALCGMYQKPHIHNQIQHMVQKQKKRHDQTEDRWDEVFFSAKLQEK